MPRERDRGQALLAAVVAMGAFGYIAFEVLAANQGAINTVSARVEQARLMAAADAGLALAIHGLANDDPARRWSIDGRSRRVEFEGTDLDITVEDERGKAPLSNLTELQARALFRGAGASGDRLDALVAEFDEWRSADTLARDPRGPPPATAIRHGPFRTVDELIGLKDMDAALLARMAPALTTFFEQSGPFDPAHARPLAITTMNAALAQEVSDAEPPDPEPDIDNEHPVEEIADDNLVGRALTVRVTARSRSGAHAHRTAIVELTGDGARPYYVRYAE